jgi:hypothetical protein
MWGVSPKDGEALHAAVMATLFQSNAIHVERGGVSKIA